VGTKFKKIRGEGNPKEKQGIQKTLPDFARSKKSNTIRYQEMGSNQFVAAAGKILTSQHIWTPNRETLDQRESANNLSKDHCKKEKAWGNQAV